MNTKNPYGRGVMKDDIYDQRARFLMIGEKILFIYKGEIVTTERVISYGGVIDKEG
jgi:hypothetical protein